MPGADRERSAREWRLRDAVRERAPGLVRLYRRRVAGLVARDRRHHRFARWAAQGAALRAQLGPPAISFEASGIWVRDPDGLEWLYLPDVWLSALGKELGIRFDPPELEHVRQVLAGGGTFVDVGAHVGGYVLPVAAAGAAVHAFEPAPPTRAILERNLERNGLADRVQVWPHAVGERPGSTALTTGWGGENHVVAEQGAGTVEVEVVTLDAFLPDRCDRVDVLKLDVEGGELAVLRGARELLRRDRPDVIVELDARRSRRYGHEPGDVVEELARLGYRPLSLQARPGNALFRHEAREP
jgi:FkbM family methyltransferase